MNEVYNHGVVKHVTREYVRRNTHTNTIEGFWSLLKRGIIGIYHYTSDKHIQRYCDEFSYRYNTKKLTQEKRFNDAVSKSKGNRLKYKDLIA